MDRRGLSGHLQRAQCDPGRVAGEGRWHVAARGRGDRPGIARHGSQCRAHLELDRGPEMPRVAGSALRIATLRILRFLLLAFAALAAACSFASEKIVASRVWPASEYTRVTLESARPVAHQFF